MIIGGDIRSVKRFKASIQQHFKMEDLGEIQYALGIKVSQDRNLKLISLSQEFYINKILTESGMMDCKPDLAYVASSLSQFLEKPSKDHVASFKWVLRYLQGSKSDGLTLGGNLTIEIQGYSDSDWGSNSDIKYFSGHGMFYGGLISWRTKKQ
ncbi:hypothetical protein O181_017271 [Austropuccinia psidii MF-1]|uniref:Reverse transcriptase Ty1/copia-type domain-containing protein n=1 Tax=Austropuccinia psidii MF-1 TaxID=1389203 RepID=A0A9Q3C359_9BASI|nr:hypothetical protein [Austropuccinia psidii MF-1]